MHCVYACECNEVGEVDEDREKKKQGEALEEEKKGKR